MTTTKSQRPPSPSRLSYPVLIGRIKAEWAATTPPWLSWSGWCPFCAKPHLHSWQEERPSMLLRAKTHRLAHCFDFPKGPGQRSQSPFTDRGYFLMLDPAWKDEAKGQLATLASMRSRWDEFFRPDYERRARQAAALSAQGVRP